MVCRCGQIFCSRHRDPEAHSCQFDWKRMQQQKVARENPQVSQAASSIESVGGWCKQHSKHHNVSSPGARHAQFIHVMAALVTFVMALRGVYLGLLEGRLILVPQQLVLGYMLGFLSVSFLPRIFGCAPGSLSCRFCIFSWDVCSRPHWCLAAEWEHAKEHIIFALSNGKRNCLTQRLYAGPRTLSHIFHTVYARLQELLSGQRCM